MAKLTRVKAKIFGETASTTNTPKEIGQFGSGKLGTYNATGDVATIQDLSAWSNGWIDAVTPNDQFPPLPEMTGVHKVLSYQEAYLLQQGVPEWDVDTDYHLNCFCSFDGIIYRSIADDNTGNEPDLAPEYWEVYGAIQDYANQDLTNLTDLGNSRLLFEPFAINQGTVLNSENNTVNLPEGSQTVVDVTGTIKNVSANNKSSYTETITFDSPKVLKSYNASYNIYPDYYSTITVTITAILNDDSEVQLGRESYYNRTRRRGTISYTFNAPTTVKAIKYKGTTSSNGSWSISNTTYVEQVTISAGTMLVCDPCVITTCDNRTLVDLGSATYELTDEVNANYCVFKDFETKELSLVRNSKFTIAKAEPTTPAADDYWLDISTVPANLKYYDNGWVINNDLVYIGNATVSGGIFTTVKNRVFNDNNYNADLPDFDNSVTIGSLPYTVEKSGWVRVYLHSSSAPNVTINGTMVGSIALTGSNNAASNLLYKVGRGDVVGGTYVSSHPCIFYPMRGVK